jgi:hypothetical protein
LLLLFVDQHQSLPHSWRTQLGGTTCCDVCEAFGRYIEGLDLVCAAWLTDAARALDNPAKLNAVAKQASLVSSRMSFPPRRSSLASWIPTGHRINHKMPHLTG